MHFKGAFTQLYIAILVFTGTTSCGQPIQNNHTNNTGQTNGAYINEINNKIKYEKEGYLYQLKYSHTDCSYEILINDVPVVSFFGIGERSLSVDINQYILKPGKQEVTIRVFPKKIDENHFLPLSKTSRVKIILKKDWRTADSRASDAYLSGNKTNWEILAYETPEIKAEIPSAEFKTSFDLADKDINWRLAGWSESPDLRNDPNIREEAEAFYTAYQQVLEAGDQAKYLDLVKTTIYEGAASTPWDRDAVKYITKNKREQAIEKRTFIYPCKNSELKFYANGRVVTLVCADTLTFGYSPLISKSEKSMLPKAHTFFLYKPKGSDQLQIIR